MPLNVEIKRLPDAVAKSIALLQIENRVELAFRTRDQLNARGREDAQSGKSRARSLVVREMQYGRRRKSQCAIEQSGMRSQRMIGLHGLDKRFSGAVPILQRGVGIARDEINRTQEIVAV